MQPTENGHCPECDGTGIRVLEGLPDMECGCRQAETEAAYYEGFIRGNAT